MASDGARRLDDRRQPAVTHFLEGGDRGVGARLVVEFPEGKTDLAGARGLQMVTGVLSKCAGPGSCAIHFATDIERHEGDMNDYFSSKKIRSICSVENGQLNNALTVEISK